MNGERKRHSYNFLNVKYDMRNKKYEKLKCVQNLTKKKQKYLF